MQQQSKSQNHRKLKLNKNKKTKTKTKNQKSKSKNQKLPKQNSKKTYKKLTHNGDATPSNCPVKTAPNTHRVGVLQKTKIP